VSHHRIIMEYLHWLIGKNNFDQVAQLLHTHGGHPYKSNIIFIWEGEMERWTKSQQMNLLSALKKINSEYQLWVWKDDDNVYNVETLWNHKPTDSFKDYYHNNSDDIKI